MIILKKTHKIRNLKTINFPFAILIIILLPIILYTQSNKKQNKIRTNLEIFEQEISDEIEKIIYNPEINRTNKFIIWIRTENKKKEQGRFTERVLKQTLNRNNINYWISKDSIIETEDREYNKLQIISYTLETKYTKLIKDRFLGEKTMERTISSKIFIKITDKSDNILISDEIRTSYRDEIPYDDYSRLESVDYKFTQSIPPNIRFLESIIFPAATVTLSALAAILFFTIRTK